MSRQKKKHQANDVARKKKHTDIAKRCQVVLTQCKQNKNVFSEHPLTAIDIFYRVKH